MLHCSQGRKKSWENGREPGVRCPVAVISWLPQWSWWTLSQRYYFFGRHWWTSIWQNPMAGPLLLVWVTHLALQRASAGWEKIQDLSAWSYTELWVSMLCICSNLTTELWSSNQWLEQFGGRSERCLYSSEECKRSLRIKHLNRKKIVLLPYISHIDGWKRFFHVRFSFSFNYRPYGQKC